ncbi:MAG: hypothetical protein ACYDGU_11945, partial [Acidiferrobacterales bacterium]
RRRLYDDFRLRLDTAYSQVRRILDAQRLQQRQLQEVNGGVAALTRMASSAHAAYVSGDLDEQSYVRLAAGLLDRRIEQTGLEQQILEQRVALQTLIGGDLPTTMPTAR